LEALFAHGEELLKGARAAVSGDRGNAEKRLGLLVDVWADCPDIKTLRADMDQTMTRDSKRDYDTTLATITEMMVTDPTGARSLLKEFEKNLRPTDAIVVKARVESAWRTLWETELTSVRHDMDEAHTYLTKINGDFTMFLQREDKEAIRGALHAVGSTENLIRAQTLLQGAAHRTEASLAEIHDPLLKSRAEGLLSSVQSTLLLLSQQPAADSRQTMAAMVPSSSSFSNILPWVISGVSMVSSLGMLMIVLKSRKTP